MSTSVLSSGGSLKGVASTYHARYMLETDDRGILRWPT
jgi:hypothetical protein